MLDLIPDKKSENHLRCLFKKDSVRLICLAFPLFGNE